jgi:predicted ATP-grasp superfamily ATP-dependent carboligase
LRVPIPQAHPGAFVDALTNELRKRPYALLIPAGDETLSLISEYRDQIEPHLSGPLGLPPREVVERVMDKGQLLDAAEGAGLRCPATVRCSSAADAIAAARAFGLPVMVKPRTSVFELGGARRREASRLAVSEPEVTLAADGFGGRCLVQLAERGDVYSFAGVYAAGGLIACSLARYIRTWPPAAGNAAFAETMRLPAELCERVSALLQRVGWEGIFELELLGHADGTFSALDLNPRLYGSVSLAIEAGADLPSTWCRWLLGERPPFATARPHVLYRWEEGELRRVLAESRLLDAVGTAAVLRPHRHTVHAYFRWNDPAPLAAWALHRVQRAARTRL